MKSIVAGEAEYQKAIDKMEARILGSRATKVALYSRVSTDDKEQNPETQLFAMRKFCNDAEWEIYQEYVDRSRAKDYVHRKAWQQLQKDARSRKFKVVLVFRLDRAFRSVKECVNLVDNWREIGIAFKSIKEEVIDTTTSQGRFITQIMAAMAELESSVIGERVSAGMARSKAEGHSLGRKRLLMPSQTICDALQGSSSVGRAAEKLGCSRPWIYKRLAKLQSYQLIPFEMDYQDFCLTGRCVLPWVAWCLIHRP